MVSARNKFHFLIATINTIKTSTTKKLTSPPTQRVSIASISYSQYIYYTFRIMSTWFIESQALQKQKPSTSQMICISHHKCKKKMCWNSDEMTDSNDLLSKECVLFDYEVLFPSQFHKSLIFRFYISWFQNDGRCDENCLFFFCQFKFYSCFPFKQTQKKNVFSFA